MSFHPFRRLRFRTKLSVLVTTGAAVALVLTAASVVTVNHKLMRSLLVDDVAMRTSTESSMLRT